MSYVYSDQLFSYFYKYDVRSDEMIIVRLFIIKSFRIPIPPPMVLAELSDISAISFFNRTIAQNWKL